MSVSWFDGLTVTVEIGFASAPLASSISWTDVSDYVRSVSIDRGRTSEYDEVRPGTATLTLDNRDRRFDPFHASGPYYGNLTPNKAVRISTEYDSITYRLFYGYVDGWWQEYDPPNDATVRLECSDGFRLLQNMRLPDSVWAYTAVTEGTPWGWYRLGESEGTTAWDSSGNSRHGTVYGSPSPASSLVYGDPDGALSLDGVDDYVEIGYGPSLASSVSVFFMWQPSDAVLAATSGIEDAGIGALVSSGSAEWTSTNSWYLGYYVLGGVLYVGVNRWNSTGSGGRGGSGQDYAEVAIAQASVTGPLYIAAIIPPSTGYIHMRLNGTSDSYACTGSATGKPILALGANSAAGFTDALMTEGVLDDVVIYESSKLGSFADFYAAALAPWDGERTDERITQVLNAVEWPLGLRNLDTGVTTLGPAKLNGAQALDYLRTVARTEDSRLFMATDGDMTFRSRHWPYTATVGTTSQATFTDSSTTYPYVDLELDGYSIDWIRTQVVGQRDGGSTLTAEDSTAVTNYGLVSETISTIHNADAEVQSFIEWRLAQRKDPKLRITRMTIAPRKAPATLFRQACFRDLGERITVERTPQGVGSAISQESWIEGVRHEITAGGRWETTWTLSPADPQDYLVLNDATVGKLDTGALAY